MNAPQLDWNLLRAFLAVVDGGSLTGAARLLASSQPTLSRQIGELEAAVGVALFERRARGLGLTAAGAALLPGARQMQTAAQTLAMAALGQSRELAGTVRLTASDMTAAYLLPPILAGLRRRHPEIQLELVVSNRVENLLERQADIALRHTRPTQTGLLARKVGDAAMGAYADCAYLAGAGIGAGATLDPARLADYDWIGYDASDTLLRGFRAAGFPVERGFFGFRCDNHATGWQMALAGMGLVIAPACIAARWPAMRPALAEGTIAPLPLWLTAHRELRHSARIRLVFDALLDELRLALNAPDNI